MKAGSHHPEGLSAAFDGLAARSLIGVDGTGLGEDMRSVAYWSHRIHRLNDDDPLVIRILHYARDIPSALGTAQ